MQLDRRKDLVRNETAIIAKFGVRPQSIPDYLALVGDAADGYPYRTATSPGGRTEAVASAE